MLENHSDIIPQETNDPLPEICSQELLQRRKAITIKNVPERNREIPEVFVDDSRDDLLTHFGKMTLKDRYLTEDESYQDRFANCVRYYADNQAHAQRLYEAISKLWCMPATPILSNGGTIKGNLMSCFVNEVPDTMTGIIDTWKENGWLAAKGGGVGVFYGNVRGIGEKAGVNGKTSGALSFMKVDDSSTSCISQGMNRRGSRAIYMNINHPEIEHFIDMRRPTGGDPDRKCLNIHHGVCIPDDFYEAVKAGADYDLVSPATGAVMETVSARGLWIKLLLARLETGEPYILNTGHVHAHTPEHHRKSGLYAKTSNLCSEIVLPTGPDHHGIDRTAICCLFQLNLDKWEEWKDDRYFINDVARFLDNVLQDYIDYAGPEFEKSRYSAHRERSIGVGVMGFHSFLQSKNIPLESAMAKSWNMRIFKHIRKHMDAASRELAEERGACPDAAEHGVMERFSYKMAIAPTASVSIIAGGSPGIDPIAANIYTQKTLDGSFEVKNKNLIKILDAKGKNTKEVWSSMLQNMGSVQHLDFLSQEEKDVYKTSFEIDQRWLIEHASDRTPMVCQSQSLNLFIPPDIHKRDLHLLHLLAWEKGVKSLYYCRTYSIQRADNTDGNDTAVTKKPYKAIDYSECLSCQ